MKKTLFLLPLLFLAPILANAQGCEGLIKDARVLVKNLKFDEAIKKVEAAKGCAAQAEIDQLYSEVFAGLKKQTNDANKAKDRAERAEKEASVALQQLKTEQEKTKLALAETQKAKLQADSALHKAQKLIDAYYFHDDKFALACGNNGYLEYYFINKNGDKVSKLGTWARATQFERTGFAKVEEDVFSSNEYLIDTAGNRYLLTSSIDGINANSSVLWLSEKNLENFSIPIETEVEKYVRENKELKNRLAKARESAIETGEWLFKGDLYTGYFYEQILEPSKPGLQWVDISSNKFKNIPRDILALQNLKILNASKNNIEDIAGISNLVNVYLLDFSHNKIKDVPSEISQLRTLNTLDIGSNQLKRLPNEIQFLENLVKLDLSSNQIESFPVLLASLKKLESLELTGNKLKVIPKEIGNFKNLRTLNLGANAVESLPDEIGQLKNLLWLNLIGNPISETEKERIQNLIPWCQVEF